MQNKKCLFFGFSFLFSCGMSNIAFAKVDYKPLGMAAGGFTIFPSLETEFEHDSNIFAVENNERNDTIFHIKPKVLVESNWSRHRMYLDFFADFAKYDKYSSEDWNDYKLDLGGVVDITRFSNLSVDLSTAQAHEDRSSSNDAGGIEPTVYERNSFELEYEHQFNRVYLTLGYDYKKFDYKDVPSIQNKSKVDINNDDRDAVENGFLVKFAYEFQPEVRAFARTKVTRIKYNDKYDDVGIQRSSDQTLINLGLSFGSNQLATGDIFVGYKKRDYDESTFDDIDGYNLGMEVTWQVTPLTRVTGLVKSDIVDSVSAGESGFLSKSANLNVDHELLRNLLLNANLGFINNEYGGITAGNTEERDDDVYSLGFGAKYNLSRTFYISGGYKYTNRNSNIVNRDYKRNAFNLSLGMQM